MNSDQSLKTIYTILLEIHIKNEGNFSLGDKTGPHLYKVETLVKWFPNSKIIYTYRDPRTVFVFEPKKRLDAITRRTIKKRKEKY